jgi:Tol biopolymer transport system component
MPPSDYPQHGFINGPDGIYFTQQGAAWGISAPSQIYRHRTGQTAFDQPFWVDSTASESDLYYSTSRQSYCFISDRSGSADIWCGEWRGGAWQSPEKLPAPINSRASEYSPVITADGDIYFASDRSGGAGMGDIYRASQTQHGWRVTSLGLAINTPGGEWNLDLSPDGSVLIFEASHRETNRTIPGDLYVSRRTGTGWGIAIPLHDLNTDGSDLMPRFIGAKAFTFTSVEAGKARQRKARLIAE